MKKTIALLITAIFFTGIGVWISPFITNNLDTLGLISKHTSIEHTTANEDTFKAGWDAARQRLVENGYMPEDTTSNLKHYVNGRIISIDETKIIIDSFSDDLLTKPELKKRTIYYNESTPVIKQYIQNNKKENITTTALKIDQSIEIYSEKEEINNKSEITPQAIIVYDFTGFNSFTEEKNEKDSIKIVDTNGETIEIDTKDIKTETK